MTYSNSVTHALPHSDSRPGLAQGQKRLLYTPASELEQRDPVPPGAAQTVGLAGFPLSATTLIIRLLCR